MAEVIPKPKLGFDMAEGTLLRQVKKDGETVAKGDLLAEIETDKATVEVEATLSGVVKGWLVAEGQPVPVGAPMVVIAGAGENVDLAAYRAVEAAAASAPTGPSAPASPLARKMAGDAGVDIRLIPGTGPGGRITKKDVAAYLAGGARPAAAPAASAVPAAAGAGVPLT